MLYVPVEIVKYAKNFDKVKHDCLPRSTICARMQLCILNVVEKEGWFDYPANGRYF